MKTSTAIKAAYVCVTIAAMNIALVIPTHAASSKRDTRANVDRTVEMEEIVISAPRATNVLHTPASVSVLTRDEIVATGAKSLGEMMQWVPGAFDSSAASSNLTIRGAGSAMAGGAMILVDGVPQRLGAGRFPEYHFIPVTRIERVEVLRSPGIDNGAGSARGVINIITRKDASDRAMRSTLSGSFGSWNSVDGQLSLDGQLGRLDYLGSVAYSRSDGYEQEKRHSLDVSSMAGFRLLGTGRLGVAAQFTQHERQNAYGMAKHAWHLEQHRRKKHFPANATDPRLVWHNTKEQDVTTITLDFAQEYESWFFNGVLTGTQFSETYQHDANQQTSPKRVYDEDRDQRALVAQLKAGLHLAWDTIQLTEVLGIQWETMRFESQRQYPNNKTKDTAPYNTEIADRQTGIYWDNELAHGSLNLDIGARVDHISMSLSRQKQQNVDKNHWLVGWRLAPAFRLTEDANVYLSVARRYWAAPPRYVRWAVSNKSPSNPVSDIQPEQSTSYEVGYKHLVSRALNVALSAYRTVYKNKYVSVYDELDFVGMKNGGRARYTGVEFEADGRLLSWLGYRVLAERIHAQWRVGEQKVRAHPSNEEILTNLKGKEVHGVPKWSFLTGLVFFPYPDWQAELTLRGTGPSFIDYANRLTAHEAFALNVRLGYRTDDFRIWLLGKNLLDTKMERVYNNTGALTKPNGVPKNRYYVQDGRYVEIGWAVDW